MDLSFGSCITEGTDQVKNVSKFLVSIRIGVEPRLIQALVVQPQHANCGLATGVLSLHTAELGMRIWVFAPNERQVVSRLVETWMDEQWSLIRVLVPRPGIRVALDWKAGLLAPGRILRFVIAFAVAEFAWRQQILPIVDVPKVTGVVVFLALVNDLDDLPIGIGNATLRPVMLDIHRVPHDRRLAIGAFVVETRKQKRSHLFVEIVIELRLRSKGELFFHRGMPRDTCVAPVPPGLIVRLVIFHIDHADPSLAMSVATVGLLTPSVGGMGVVASSRSMISRSSGS